MSSAEEIPRQPPSEATANDGRGGRMGWGILKVGGRGRGGMGVQFL